MNIKNQNLKIKGTVANVCQNEGRKLALVDGNRDVKVSYENDAFQAPKAWVGKTVAREGVFLPRTGDMKCAGEARRENLLRSLKKYRPAWRSNPPDVVPGARLNA